MDQILIVDEGEQLLRRVRGQGRDARTRRLLENAETVSWEGFPARVREHAPDGVAVFNLTAPGALSLKDAARLPSDFPGLRALYVLDTEKPLSERHLRQLSRPGVDFVSDRASGAELQSRMQRLLEPIDRSVQRPGRFNRAKKPECGEPAESAPLMRGLMPILHNPKSGRLDAKRIADWFGLPLTALAQALGRQYAAVHKTPDAPALQEDLHLYLQIASDLQYLAGSYEGAQVWLGAKIPDFEDHVPRDLLTEGQGAAEMIAAFLEDSLYGQPG